MLLRHSPSQVKAERFSPTAEAIVGLINIERRYIINHL